MAEVKKTISEWDKREALKDLNKLLKCLRSYKNLQEKRLKVSFNDKQKRYLNFRRQNIKQQYVLNKKIIAEYGTDTQVIVLRQPWDIFDYVLRTLNMNPDQFNKLEKSMNIIETTIKNIETTPVAKFELRDISLTRKITKPVKEPVIEQKDTTESPIQLFDALQLHPRIIKASKSLFNSGHYAEAIFAAFKAINNFTKRKIDQSLDGKDLMAKAFNEDKPIIKINKLTTRSERDEQEGFRFLFMGAMVGIRNPKAHDDIRQIDPYKTLEYLAFASLLMRRATEGKLEPKNK